MPNERPDDLRRRIVNWLLGISATGLFASIAYPIARFISPPKVPEATTNRVEAGRTNDPELREQGYKIVRFGAEPVILVRLADGEFRAFAATCTHLDCIVEYQKDRSRIWCNCHNGFYNLQGQVVSGPPPRPLPRYDVNVLRDQPTEPGTIVISRA